MGLTTSVYQNDDQSIALRQLRQYFAVRVNTFDELILVGQFIADDIGEQILDCFCLTEIDQWDAEHERYLFLCESSLIAIDFDFCRLQICNTRILPYELFDRIRIGQLCYENFVFENHSGKLGMKFTWSSPAPTPGFNDRSSWNSWNSWNLFNTATSAGHAPCSLLLTSHPLKGCIEKALYANLDDSYFTSAYLRTVYRRFSIEVFHDKLFYILQSLHSCVPLNTPRFFSSILPPSSTVSTSLLSPSDEIREITRRRVLPDLIESDLSPHHGYRNNYHECNYHENDIPQRPASTLIQLERRSHPAMPTFINYSPIVISNVFNLPGYIYNRVRAGYNRLRYV